MGVKGTTTMKTHHLTILRNGEIVFEYDFRSRASAQDSATNFIHGLIDGKLGPRKRNKNLVATASYGWSEFYVYIKEDPRETMWLHSYHITIKPTDIATKAMDCENFAQRGY